MHIIPPEVTFLRGGGVATVAKPAEAGPSYLPTYIIMYKWTLIADENWIILFAYQLPRDNGRSRSGLLRISASSSLSSINYYRLFPDAGQVGKSLRAGNRASKREICLFPSRLGFKSKSSFAWIRHGAASNVLGLASSSSSIGRYLPTEHGRPLLFTFQSGIAV